MLQENVRYMQDIRNLACEKPPSLPIRFQEREGEISQVAILEIHLFLPAKLLIQWLPSVEDKMLE